MAQKQSQPYWRRARFGDNWEFVRRRPGGGPTIWFGTVEPVIDGRCGYSTPLGRAYAPTLDEAKQAVEQIAANL